MGKDWMTVKGIKKGRKGSVYCDWSGDEEGIFYLKDKVTGFLIRQVLPQDLEIVKKYRRVAAEGVVVRNKDSNRFVTYDKIMEEESDNEILEMIHESFPRNNENGDISLIVFNMKTKEFIAIMDVIQVGNSEKAIIGFTFSNNEVIKRHFESKLKKRIKEILIEQKICKSMKEEIWSVQQSRYVNVPM